MFFLKKKTMSIFIVDGISAVIQEEGITADGQCFELHSTIS